MKSSITSRRWIAVGLLVVLGTGPGLRAAEVHFEPAAELRLFYDGYPQSAGASVDQGQAAGLLLHSYTQVRTTRIDWETDLDLLREAHRVESSLDVLDLTLRSGLTRRISEHSEFNFDVTAAQSTRGGIQSGPSVLIIPTIPGLTTQRVGAALGAGMQMSPRNRFRWRVGGDTMRFADGDTVAFDEVGNVVLQANQGVEASVGWDYIFPQRSSIGLGYEARHYWFELSPETRVQSVRGEMHSGIGHNMQWYVSAGPVQVEQLDPLFPEPTNDVEIDTSVEVRTSPLSVLSIGAGRMISAGSGLGGVTRDQSVFAGWGRRPLTGMTFLIVLGGWDQELLEPSTITTEQIDEARYLELREEFLWGVGRSVWLGVNHAYRYVTGDPRIDAQYHMAGVVVRWEHRGREEPPFSHTAAGQRLAAAFRDQTRPRPASPSEFTPIEDRTDGRTGEISEKGSEDGSDER
jgi:hypothetical protein